MTMASKEITVTLPWNWIAGTKENLLFNLFVIIIIVVMTIIMLITINALSMDSVSTGPLSKYLLIHVPYTPHHYQLNPKNKSGMQTMII